MPRNTAAIDKNTEIITYMIGTRILLDKNNSTTSQENAEKVVKEPKKPIIKKYFTNISFIFFAYPNEIKYPIKKDPKMFTNKVE